MVGRWLEHVGIGIAGVAGESKNVAHFIKSTNRKGLFDHARQFLRNKKFARYPIQKSILQQLRRRGLVAAEQLVALLVGLGPEGIEVRVQGAGILLCAVHLVGIAFPFAGQYATLCGDFCPLAYIRCANADRRFTGNRVCFEGAKKEWNG